jgi:hypothetical protein
VERIFREASEFSMYAMEWMSRMFGDLEVEREMLAFDGKESNWPSRRIAQAAERPRS